MYVFDNAAPQAAARLAVLAQVFDPGTIRHLDARGVGPGWRCLEVGGGLGSITRWLSARVGPLGRVLATDIDTRHLLSIGLSNVDVREHDIVADPLPEGAFDLAYARLVLEHLADPDVALARMVKALKPGGWLLVEDFEVLPASSGPPRDDVECISKTAAAMRQVTAAAGINQRLGRSLARRMRSHALANVDCEGRVFLWRGGSSGATLARLNAEQLRAAILGTGELTVEEFDRDLAALDDQACELRSPILWSAWGQRP
jgi:SAM-dependent methyltransferase